MTKRSQRLYSVGEKYLQFRVTRAIELSELQCYFRELIHEPSGANIMHIENDDPENLFCLSFRTTPLTSNGVAHILEHTVLCGSEKFPVKDPFFAMNRRSLNTFMNALTGADFTCYPAASQVPMDFYNLLEVYLDAVFHPNLNRLSFLQEGHRLEFSHSDDPQSALEYKGIVFNEMKGALSSSTARLSEVVNEMLFPDITYGRNSGGDPRDIPQLTYEELKQFYHTHYHPSRCLFFFYGNLPLEQHLDFIEKHTLTQTKKVTLLPSIPLQPRFTTPRFKEAFYPIASEESLNEKTLIAFAWLTCHILQQEDLLALNILEIILMDTDASPLKMAFQKSGLCKQANSFLDIEINEIPWGIILRGCEAENLEELEKILQKTLNHYATEGIPLTLIENAIHQLEFYRSEISGDHAPFGLSLFMRSGLLKQHGANPEEGLLIHTLFERLRQNHLANPHYFSEIIQKYFIQNPHFVKVVMKPDPELGTKETEEEKQILKSIKDSLTVEQKETIIKQATELAEFQKKQKEENIDILPKISLKNVPQGAKDYPLTIAQAGHLTVFHRQVFTNGIVYADLVYDLPQIAEEDWFYLRLFTFVLPQMGCGGRTYVDTLDYIQGNTGGISTAINLNMQAKDCSQFTPTFHLKGKALNRKASKLFPLMHDMIAQANLNDLKRLKEIILKHFSALESKLNQSALRYAINLSASPLNAASKLANHLFGIHYYHKLKEIVEQFQHRGNEVLEKLQQIQKQVTCLERPHLVITSEAAIYSDMHNHEFYGLRDIETRPFKPWQNGEALHPIPPQGYVLASPVAFIAKAFPTVGYTHPMAPALGIAAFLFDNLVLHKKIREQGGAYGGGSASNSLSGNFYFYSYRDPNIVQTLSAFEEAVEEVRLGHFEETDLEEAKLEMIQGLDTPTSPGSQGEISYSRWKEGRSLETRQRFRNVLLSLSQKDIIEAVEQQIYPRFNQGTPAVFAGKVLLEKANEKFLSMQHVPLVIRKI